MRICEIWQAETKLTSEDHAWVENLVTQKYITNFVKAIMNSCIIGAKNGQAALADPNLDKETKVILFD